MSSDPQLEALTREVASLRTYLLKVANQLRFESARDFESPSDIVHRALKSALMNIREGKCQASSSRETRAWVRAILINKYRDAQRAAFKHQRSDLIDDIPDTAQSAAALVEKSEERSLVRQALERLEPRDRQLLLWRQSDGLKFREIGERLGISLQGAKQAYLRAARRFRVVFENLGGPLSGNHREAT